MNVRRHNRGFILFLVLAVLSALILMVIHLLEIVNLERELSSDYSHKVRSRLIARSGVEYALAIVNSKKVKDSYYYDEKNLSLGMGTYAKNGDVFDLSINDANAKININDGVLAGRLEAVDDSRRNITVDWEYDSSTLNPWPNAGNTQAIINNNLMVNGSTGLNKSGLINLRLRRLLNALGDVHMAKSTNLISQSAGSLPSGFKLTSSASGNRGVQAPEGEGLGDVIIANRPNRGYRDLKETKIFVNRWALSVIDPTYYSDEYDSFFDKIEEELTVKSYEDSSFYRLRTEIAATYDATGPNINSTLSPHMWLYQNSVEDPSLSTPGNPQFIPNYLDRFPIDLTDDSGNATLDKNGTAIDVDNNLWSPHSVALINLNAASEAVKAAVLYAPVNVSYLCESALTHLDQMATWHTTSSHTNTYPDHRDDRWRVDRGYGRHSIGVRGPCFNPAKLFENGVLDSGDPTQVQVNHLMSLRDSLHLAKYYDWYLSDTSKEVYNFDGFKTLLTRYRKDKRLDLIDSSTSGVPNDGIAYERAEIIPLDASTELIDFEPSGNKDTLFYEGNSDHKVRASFVDVNDKDNVDIIWVSQYWPRDPADLSGPWDGGWFLEDYVERTLPHVLSCVRRIPGYLGAPLALTSPYMILEPYSYSGPNHPTSLRHRQGSEIVDGVIWAAAGGVGTWPDTPDTFISNAESDKHLGMQPKISVEDLVTRHTLPKVCFLANGIFAIKSIGMVKNPVQEVISQTTITAVVQVFDVKTYRTQSDFISILSRDPNTGDIKIGTNSDDTHPDIVFGPEFKLKRYDPDPSRMPSAPYLLEDRVASDYWLALGCRDADSMAGGKYTSGPSSGEPYMPSNPVSQPSATGQDDHVKSWDLFLTANPYDEKGGLNQELDVNTILEDYGSDAWHGLSLEDERPAVSLYTASYLLRPDLGDRLQEGWRGLGYRAFVEWMYIDLGYALPHNLNLPSRYSGPINLSAQSPEFVEKLENRLLVPHGSNIKRDGDLENSRDELWAQKDPHDLCPFGGGIFLSSNGNGEYADQDPDPHPRLSDPITGLYDVSKAFRDTLYWPLNTKVKNFDRIADVDRDHVLDDSDGIVGIPDVYEFDQASYSPFSQTDGDINSVGVAFHRGFMAAWFRIPTSYPFAQPVFYSGHVIEGGASNETNNSDHVRNKSHLFSTIMSLHVIPTLRWDYRYNDTFPSIQSKQKSDSGKYTQPLTTTGYNDIDIKVGYFSGFDIDGDFEFEHGIVGYFDSHCYTSGVLLRSMSTTKYGNGWFPYNLNHPLALVETTAPRALGSSYLNEQYYNRVYGYFWDYDYMMHTPFKFDNNVGPELVEPNTTIHWNGGNDETGFIFQEETFDRQGGSKTKHIPLYHMAWKQDYQELNDNRAAGSDSVNSHPTLPVNHVFYESHSGTRGAYGSYLSEIKHKLRMNNTPECGPGSWHRVYSFWFLRFNPGQMGNGDATHEEMGDTLKYSKSDYWDGSTGEFATDFPTYTAAETPYEAIGSTVSFAEGRSRYAEDDALLDDVNTNAAFDVDGLDQFGIWFRDDSNYEQWCSNTINPSLPAFDKKRVKPQFSSLRNTGFEGFPELVGRLYNPTNHISIGSTHFRRATPYCPASGEPRYKFGSDNIPGIFSSPGDPDHYRRSFPIFLLNSTVDDFIFAYGSDISVPYIANTTTNWNGTYPNSPIAYPGNDITRSSYFRGLFHNAYWLADQTDPYERHADEVRYDIRSLTHPKVVDGTREVNQPQLVMDLSMANNNPEIEDGSKIFHVGCRFYFPPDTVKNNQYNYSDLRMDVMKSGSSQVNTSPTHRSYNHQDFFFDELFTSKPDDLSVVFKYTGNKRERDFSEGSTPVNYHSTIFNHNQDYGINSAYESDGGDSFTNIPYIQELTLRCQRDGEIQFLSWSE